MILMAGKIGLAELACELAALLDVQDIFQFESAERTTDIRERLDAIRSGDSGSPGRQLIRSRLQTVREHVSLLKRKLRLGGNAFSEERIAKAGIVAAFAYPDRIAFRRPGTEGECRFLMANGRGARFANHDPLEREKMLVAISVDYGAVDAKILLAAPLDPNDFEIHFGKSCEIRESVEWNPEEQRVIGRRRRVFGEWTLRETVFDPVNDSRTRPILLEGIAKVGIASLPWSENSLRLLDRIRFLQEYDSDGDWPDVSPDVLSASLSAWLEPFLGGISKCSQLTPQLLRNALAAWIGIEKITMVERLAPETVTLTNGRKLRVEFRPGESPSASVRIQHLFGVDRTPTVLGGRVRVTLHLLSPAGRTAQITGDLSGFWKNSYHRVRKDLRGRYPRHAWPEDPTIPIPPSCPGGRPSG
jgi:ATP-dependent helicase HrpB